MKIRIEIEPKEWVSNMVLILTVSAIIMGNVAALDFMRIFGIAPTYFRVVIVLASLYYLCKRFIFKKTDKKASKLFIGTMIMMAVWVAYIVVQMLVIKGADKEEGARDILALFFAALSIYCMYDANTTKQSFRLIVLIMRVLLALFMLLALFEMTTAYHLPMSKYNDPAFINSQWYLDHYGANKIEMYTATGLYYNQNDFFFVISLFSMVFLPAETETRRQKVFCYTMLAIIFTLLSINSAFITLLAMIAGILVFLLLTRAGLKKHGVIWGGGAIIQFWVSKLARDFLRYLGNVLKGRITLFGEPIFTDDNTRQLYEGTEALSQVLSHQFATAAEGQGSLFRRLTMYIDCLGAFVKTYGFGLGPAGLKEYFTRNESRADLVDPHNWWLEVLAQYGVIIFLIYFVAMLAAFVKTVREYIKTHFWGFAMVAGMLVIFAIGCIAPSSLLRASHQWMPLALAVSLQGTSHLYVKTEGEYNGDFGSI